MTDSGVREEIQLKVARHLFWLTFVIAAVASLLLGLDPSARLAPAIGASAVMLVYLLVCKVWTPLALKQEDYADGFYYLGFLLTLIALVATLVSLGDVAEENVQQVVLSRFGLALSTTIVGLGVRTVLRMFQEAARTTSRDTLTRAQEDLRRASEALRVVLQNAATDMETSLGAAANRIDSAVGGLTSRLSTLGVGLETVSKRLSPLSDAFGANENAARALAGGLGAVHHQSDGLRNSIDTVGAALTTLTGPIERSATGLDAVAASASKTADVIQQLDTVSGSLRTQVEALERLARRLEDIPDAGASIRRLTESVESGCESIAQFVHAMNEADRILGSLRERADSVDLGSMGELAGLMRRQLGAINSSIDDWQAALTQLADITRRLGEKQADAAGSLIDVQRELSAGVQFLREVASRGD